MDILNAILNKPNTLIKKYQKAMGDIKNNINQALNNSKGNYDEIQKELEAAQQDTIKLFSQIRNDRTLFSSNAARREDARNMFANSWCSEKEIEMAIIAAIDKDDEEFRAHLPVSIDKSKILALPEAFVYELIDPFSPNFAQDQNFQK